MQVALFGGSFNPPHVGHLLAAIYVRSIAEVDAVWLLPVHRHAFGKHLEPFEDRVAMCEALCAGIDGLAVSRAESERDGPGYTLLTVRHLQARHPGWRFRLVLGTDIVADLPRWHRWEELVREAPPLLIGRAGHPLSGAHREAARAMGLELRDAIALPEVSSTEVRRRLAGGETVDGLVPRSVLALCRQRQLYGAR